MNPSLQNEWRLNALSFAKHPVQMTAAVQRALLIASANTKTSLPVTMPMLSKLSSSSKTILMTDKDSLFAKSSAQVAPLVAPQVVRPKACELKLDPEPSGRRHPLGVRFSDAELAEVKAKAKKAGCSTNRYIRAAALGADTKTCPAPEWTKALLTTNLELTRQGSNLNQIAKHMNGGKASPAEAEGLLGAIARSMLMTHKAVRVALTQGRTPVP